ncbi:NAD(P)/FAD-dependent oxidoreductase [Streptomyces sp. NBC_00091]|uniref:NAD(P)/FAD-dependent oxidoreductase n=1 Tax=Streptomyces sp. NBC_00091 TaxID=2975648 RepID=UPI00225512BA|nr:FAD-dependent oxidoreductase [Streptomyces sp. NBC_00091]MCX5376715.1 FAD-dependent oxidoreductase [Streptomyces sp. NBC_00091]
MGNMTDTGQKQHVVVVGAGYAGMTAALRVSRRHRVTLVDPKECFAERIRLHERAAGRAGTPIALRELVAGRDITPVTAKAASIDPDTRTVRLDNGATLTYDRLVYALGSSTDTTRVPGITEHAYTLEQARELSDRLAHGTGTVTIVGGGTTGIELAAELAESAGATWRVRLVTGSKPGGGLSAAGRAYVCSSLEGLGVRLHPHTRVRAVHGGGLSTDRGELASDVVVWAAAFTVPSLAAEAGLRVDERGRALVDGAMRSLSHPDVFVVGDAARVTVPGAGELRMACATAMPTGAHAAESIEALSRGREPRPLRFRYLAQCISLGRRDGIIQPVRTDDSAHRLVITGRPAARINEWINRYTLNSLHAERRRPGTYRWAKPLLPS